MILPTLVTPERLAMLTMAVGWGLVWFVAQGLLVGLAIAALLRALSDRSANLRYSVGCAGLIAMIACPVGTTLQRLAAGGGADRARPHVPVGAAAAPARGPVQTAVAGAPGQGGNAFGPAIERPASEAGTHATAPVVLAAPTTTGWALAWRQQIERALPAVVAAWLLGVGVMALRLARGLVDVRSLTRREVLAPTAEIEELISALVARAGLRRPVEWLLSLRVEVPAVVGWLRPTVLIPARGLAHLTMSQLEALLAHELAHIRRYDYLVNLVQVAVETVLFFHPAVWWLSRRIRAERESCCDELAAVLCGGDRRLVARALLTLEEERCRPPLRLAATGGSLKERVRRLVAPAPAELRAAEAAWAGGVLVAGLLGLVAAVWLARPSQAGDTPAPKSGPPVARGHVLDDEGHPVPGARVRLYLRENRWARQSPLLEEVAAGALGEFALWSPLEAKPLAETRGQAPYALVADHAGKAVGWKVIPAGARTFEGDIILTKPVERPIAVADAIGRPVKGATVTVYALGDRASPRPEFREFLELRPEDGPLTAVTGADGRATFHQLPGTHATFIATKPGFAKSYAFRDQATIRLTPAANLSGTVTGPDGQPLAGVKVVLFTKFMWDFEHAVTDSQGRYAFSNLRAAGWDMSAWTAGKEGDGRYAIWLDDDRFAMPTQTLKLDPGEQETLDIHAVKAGAIHVTVVERGTERPVADVRIWGLDNVTGSSGRFNAYTDAKGRATFHTTPSRIVLSLVGPPDGVYLDGNLHAERDARVDLDFQGGDLDLILRMPPIAGRLVAVSGVCKLPDGTPAADAQVSVEAGRFNTSGATSFVRSRRTDSAGRFSLEHVPSGHGLHLYAETADRRFAGIADAPAPGERGPAPMIPIRLTPTVVVERVIKGGDGTPLAARQFYVAPKVQSDEFVVVRRIVQSDAEGKIKFDGIVPGLSYRILEQPPQQDQPVVIVAGNRPWYEDTLVLAPSEKP